MPLTGKKKSKAIKDVPVSVTGQRTVSSTAISDSQAPIDVDGLVESFRQTLQNGVARAGMAPPGYFYDPKTGKTFRQKKPKPRSKAFRDSLNYERRAAKELSQFLTRNELQVDQNGQTLKKIGGGSLSNDLKEEHEFLRSALIRAREVHKQIRTSEAKPPKVGGKQTSAYDVRNQAPALRTYPETGKLAFVTENWADMA
jgi:hypothetical protein